MAGKGIGTLGMRKDGREKGCVVDLYCLEELVDFMGRLTIEKEGLMDFGRRITLYVLLYIALCSAAFAQVVEIPRVFTQR